MITRKQLSAAAQLMSRRSWERRGREKRQRAVALKLPNQAQYQVTMETLLRGRLKGLAIARQRTHRNRGAARRMAALASMMREKWAREDAQLTE
jgi:hypothetical protein